MLTCHASRLKRTKTGPRPADRTPPPTAASACAARPRAGRPEAERLTDLRNGGSWPNGRPGLNFSSGVQPARGGPDLIATKSQSLPTDVQPATMSSGDHSRRTFVRPCVDQPFELARRRRYGSPGPEGGAAIRCVHHGCPVRGQSLPRSCTTHSPTSVSTHAGSSCNTPPAQGKCPSHGPCDTLSAGSGIPGWWRRCTPSPGRTARRRVMKPRRPLIASSQKTAEVARGEPQRLAGGVGQVTSVRGLADPVADGAAGVEQADIRNRRRHGSRVGELRICPWASQGAVQGIGRLVGDPAEGYRRGAGWRASSDLLAALAKPSGCERSWRAHNELA